MVIYKITAAAEAVAICFYQIFTRGQETNGTNVFAERTNLFAANNGTKIPINQTVCVCDNSCISGWEGMLLAVRQFVNFLPTFGPGQNV